MRVKNDPVANGARIIGVKKSVRAIRLPGRSLLPQKMNPRKIPRTVWVPAPIRTKRNVLLKACQISKLLKISVKFAKPMNRIGSPKTNTYL